MTLSDEGRIVSNRRAKCAACQYRKGEFRCMKIEDDIGLSPATHTYDKRLHDESAAGCPVGEWLHLMTEHGE